MVKSPSNNITKSSPMAYSATANKKAFWKKNGFLSSYIEKLHTSTKLHVLQVIPVFHGPQFLGIGFTQKHICSRLILYYRYKIFLYNILLALNHKEKISSTTNSIKTNTCCCCHVYFCNASNNKNFSHHSVPKLSFPHHQLIRTIHFYPMPATNLSKCIKNNDFFFKALISKQSRHFRLL